LPKRAFITGITGQDGGYLTELLLQKGYEIHGLVPPGIPLVLDGCGISIPEKASLFLHGGDLSDGKRLRQLLAEIRPDEIYNLGAQSSPLQSFGHAEETAQITGLGPLRILEAIHAEGIATRFFQAGTAELFGKNATGLQAESDVFRPASPYGAAKAFAHWMTVHYREAYGLYACNGILFNHESPRRSEEFVTRKITLGLARILAGKQEKICLGSLDVKRDWGYAGDFVQAMWLMLQQARPDDYVVATGETHSVREFLEEAFGYVGRKYQDYVEMDPGLLRSSDSKGLAGDSSKARRVLGWRPTKTFAELVRFMVDEDLKLLGRPFLSFRG